VLCVCLFALPAIATADMTPSEEGTKCLKIMVTKGLRLVLVAPTNHAATESWSLNLQSIVLPSSTCTPAVKGAIGEELGYERNISVATRQAEVCLVYSILLVDDII
jgi:hypothetical protein